jgi:hypothetical protein
MDELAEKVNNEVVRAIHRLCDPTEFDERMSEYKPAVAEAKDAILALIGQALLVEPSEEAALASLREAARVFAEETGDPYVDPVEEYSKPEYGEDGEGLRAEIQWELRCLRAAYAIDARPVSVTGKAFQEQVQPWVVSCFGEGVAADKLERNDRFIEEALELTQACGYTKDRAHDLVDYVFDRKPGDPFQEVGGVMVTLAAHCIAHGLNMHEAGDAELARISTPEMQEKIRAKQAAKPKGSALPVAASIAEVSHD